MKNSIRRLLATMLVMLCGLSLSSCIHHTKFLSNNANLTAEEIYEKVAPSVVRISTDVSTGSGFFYDHNGTIITNYHVIENCSEATIELYNGKTYEVEKVLGYSVQKDIAILSTTCKNTTPLKIRTQNIKTGETIYTLGSSLGVWGWSLSDGLISNSSRKTSSCEYIQITAPISPGNSGGPLIDEKGYVIGITTLSFTGGQNVNFAVSASEIKTISTSFPRTFAQLFGVDLDEKPTTSSMYVKDYKTQFNEENGEHLFFFTLTDEDDVEMSGSGKVEIRIVNDDGTTVYKQTKTFTDKDFGVWKNSYGEYYHAAIYIKQSEITEATKSEGTLYFKLSVDYFVWEELSCSISYLPIKNAIIECPSIDTVVSSIDYKGSVESQVNISALTYENSNSDGTSLNIYVSGEKVFDSKGNSNNDACWFKWKLYDSDGYMIQSGTVITDDLMVGEKFKEKIWVYDIIPGNDYTIKFFDYD